MAETTLLQIRTRGSTTSRTLELPGSSVRIGRGPQCEVRLAEPSIADVQCLLRRRGETWHLQPVGPPGRVSIDGIPVVGRRDVPLGMPVRVGEHWITLRPSDPPAADRASAVDHRLGVSREVDAGLSPEATEPPRLDATVEEERQRLLRWETRLRQRERWLQNQQDQRRWEARWRAAGESLRSQPPAVELPQRPGWARDDLPRGESPRPEPSPIPAPPQARKAPEPARPVARPEPLPEIVVEPEPIEAVAADRPPVADALPMPFLEAWADEPAPDARPTAAPDAEPEPARPSAAEARSGSSTVPPPLRIPRPTPTIRVSFSKPVPPTVAATAPAAEAREAEPPAPVVEAAPELEPVAASWSAPIEEEEFEAESTEYTPGAEPEPVELPPTIRVEAADPELLPPVPTDVEVFGPEPGPACDAEEPVPLVVEIDAPAAFPEVEPEPVVELGPIAEPAVPPVRDRSGSSWPSAREILGAGRPEPARPAAVAAPTKADRRRRRPMPTVARAPESWSLPGGALLGLPILLLQVAIGAAALAMAAAFADGDSALGPIADRGVRERQAPNRELPWIPPLRRAGDPSWWNTRSEGLWWLAFLANHQDADPDREIEADRRLQDARSAAPAAAAVRYTLAVRDGGKRDAAPSSWALGLSRDVLGLTLTGRRLQVEGKADAATRAFRAAVDLAAAPTGDPSPPRFDADAKGTKRFQLPREEMLTDVVREIVVRSPLPWDRSAIILAPYPTATLIAARMLKERGSRDADAAFRLLHEPAADGPSSATRLAARAEGFALLERYGEAADAYREAVGCATGDLERRTLSYNLADVARIARDEAGARAALEDCRAGASDDEVARRALQLERLMNQLGGGVERRATASRSP